MTDNGENILPPPEPPQYEPTVQRAVISKSASPLPPICTNGKNSRDSSDTKSFNSIVKSLSGIFHKENLVQTSASTSRPPVRPERRRLPKLTRHINKNDGLANVKDYLDNNKDFLEAYVIDSIPVDELERWRVKKMTQSLRSLETSYNKMVEQKIKIQLSFKDIFLNIIKKLPEDSNEHTVMREIAYFVSFTVGVHAYRVYKLHPDDPSFIQYLKFKNNEDNHIQLVRADSEDVKLIHDVTKRCTVWRLSRDNIQNLFPKTPLELFNDFGVSSLENADHLMYVPILNAAGKTVYIIEMWRKTHKFTMADEELSSNFIVYGSLTLHSCIYKRRERNMAEFLLEVVKAIFEEMVSLDQLIKRILEFAQRLVNADRASLFLVDYRNFELVSTVFDLKFEPGHVGDMERKEIRMPMNRGIAGHVAQSGETMNIPDVYSDDRFNREVDEITGYKTISILCMPVKVQGKVIGVVQMVNKRNNNKFDNEDEVAFERFSTIFGLALHHARLYDKIMRKEQKYKVALEILSYHNTCKEHEVDDFLNRNNSFDIRMDDFYLDPYKFDDFQKCKAVVTMFDDLFALSNFDVISVSRFILTVKKNYRSVPYHNFDHGWSVAHAMYVIIKNDKRKRFDYKMRLALFVACLCHDLDHRGYTNKYMNETASPLASMYTTSPLEHHHFNITVTILQQDGHNIFSHLSSEDYKDILRYVRHCILATDLAAFFPNLARMKDICGKEATHQKFDWEAPEHKHLAMAISMTAADLSASAKPWEVQIKTVKVIFEEFYDQGDKERAAGKIPITMMDRNKPEEQAASQVGFLSEICEPCYNMLYKILPNTKPMYEMALMNLKNWKSQANCIQNNTDKNNDDTLTNISEIELDGEEFVSDDDDVITENLLNKSSNLNQATKIVNAKLNHQLDSPIRKLKSDSVSFDEDCHVSDTVNTTYVKVLSDIPTESFLGDEEGLVKK